MFGGTNRVCSKRLKKYPKRLRTYPRGGDILRIWLNLLAPVVQRLDNAIQRISCNKTNHAIRWIAIYPVDSVIQPLNNRGQVINLENFSFSSRGYSRREESFWEEDWEWNSTVHVCCRRREGLARKEKTLGEVTCMQIYELYEGEFKSPKPVEGRF